MLNEYSDFPKDLQSYGISLDSPQGEGPLYLNNAYIKQDFSKDKGQFSFVITYPANITEITFNFPVKVDGPSFKCYYKNSTSDYLNKIPLKSLDCIARSSDNKTFVLEFNKTSFLSETVIIEYTLKFSPIGYFEIFTNQIWYAGREGNIVLELGNDYECVAECIYPWQNTKIASGDEIAQVRVLNFEDPSKNRNFIFKLITKSNKVIRYKT